MSQFANTATFYFLWNVQSVLGKYAVEQKLKLILVWKFPRRSTFFWLCIQFKCFRQTIHIFYFWNAFQTFPPIPDIRLISRKVQMPKSCSDKQVLVTSDAEQRLLSVISVWIQIFNISTANTSLIVTSPIFAGNSGTISSNGLFEWNQQLNGEDEATFHFKYVRYHKIRSSVWLKYVSRCLATEIIKQIIFNAAFLCKWSFINIHVFRQPSFLQTLAVTSFVFRPPEQWEREFCAARGLVV